MNFSRPRPWGITIAIRSTGLDDHRLSLFQDPHKTALRCHQLYLTKRTADGTRSA